LLPVNLSLLVNQSIKQAINQSISQALFIMLQQQYLTASELHGS